MKINEGQDEE